MRRSGRVARAAAATAAAAALFGHAMGAQATESWKVRSGPRQVATVELFTSQGCSSCPPAEAWMSRLTGGPRLWQDYVPLAFHVDYWDYIGWRDPFARPAWSERQRRYADERGFVTVYTPGFVVNGREWRRWRTGEEPAPPQAIAGELAAEIVDGRVQVRFDPPSAADRPPIAHVVAHVAVLGFDLTSRVTAGENEGRRLRNDFVVLGLAEAGMSRGDGGHVASLGLPTPDVHAPRTAIAVWVSSDDGQAPLQAAGGWYEK